VYAALVEWYWEKYLSIRRKSCTSATWSTRNPTLTHNGPKPCLPGEKPTAKRLNHGTYFRGVLWACFRICSCGGRFLLKYSM